MALQKTKIKKQTLLPFPLPFLTQSTQYQNWKANIYSTLANRRIGTPQTKPIDHWLFTSLKLCNTIFYQIPYPFPRTGPTTNRTKTIPYMNLRHWDINTTTISSIIWKHCSHTKSHHPTILPPTFPKTSPGKTRNHPYSTPPLPVESPLETSQSPQVRSLIVWSRIKYFPLYQNAATGSMHTQSN